MKRHLTRYLVEVKNILFFFVMYGAQEQAVLVTGHDIIVRGSESLGNILHKTLVVMRYCFECKNYKFDYVIRSCISTVFNFGKLRISDFIKKDYTSSLLIPNDPENFPDSLGRPYVAKEQTPYIGNIFLSIYLIFASGSNIFLSKRAVHHVLDSGSKYITEPPPSRRRRNRGDSDHQVHTGTFRLAYHGLQQNPKVSSGEDISV
jgi:hypothetical protein